MQMWKLISEMAHTRINTTFLFPRKRKSLLQNFSYTICFEGSALTFLNP